MHDFKDELMGHVEWDRNRQVLVFARTVGDRRFVRMRVFNRHTRKGCYYPAPRAFQVSQECAGELGLAIARAAEGCKSTAPPEWWPEFEEQYPAGAKRAGKW